MAEPRELDPEGLRGLLLQAQNVGDVLHVLDTVEGLPPLPEPRERHWLRLDCFDAARQLSREDPENSKRLLLDRLLPICLRPAPEEDKLTEARYRELLKKWLTEFSDEPGQPVRAEALRHAVANLTGPNFKPACWTIAEIGYRSPDVEAALQAIAASPDVEQADVALSVLIDLGVPPASESRIVGEVLERVRERPFSRQLRFCMYRLAAKEFVEPVRAVMAGPPVPPPAGEEREDEPFGSQLYAFDILARIATRWPDDGSLQDAVWTLIAERREAGPDQLDWGIYVASNVPSSCNSPRVVQDFFRWIIDDAPRVAAGDALGRRRTDLALLRLEDCVRPRQMEGWTQVPIAPALAALRPDATLNTRHPGRFSTSEMRLKFAAWETVMCLGAAAPPDWLVEAVGGETNNYVRGSILEKVATAPPAELADFVADVVVEPHIHREREDDDGQFFFRMGATRLAHSIPTRASLDALLSAGLRAGDDVFLASTDAVGDVALDLVNAGQVDVVEHLFVRLQGAPSWQHRTLALAGIERLAESGKIGGEHGRALITAAEDHTLPQYSRRRAIWTIGFLTPVVPDDVLEVLNRTALGEDKIAGDALETLARLDAVRGNAALRERVLAAIGSARSTALWPPACLGLMYQKDPQGYGTLVADAVRSLPAGAANILFALLRNVIPAPAAVGESIVQRITKGQSKTQAEVMAFETLALVDPSRLATEPWERLWDRWRPEARAALADALAGAQLESPQSKGRAVSILNLLMSDGLYAVRRSALRAQSAVSPHALERAIANWANDPSADRRRRAAEAAAWFTSDYQSAFVLSALAGDREPDVREGARRAQSERRERTWASSYLTRVLRASKADPSEILDAYRYGRALTRLGDDQAIRELERAAARSDLTSNGRHWFKQIVKELRKKWEKTVQQWPHPWTGWNAVAIEEASGEAAFGNGPGAPAVQVRCYLWWGGGETTTAKSHWGGACWPTGPRPFGAIGADWVTLRLHGRREAKALAASAHFSSSGVGDVIVLTGSGPYPSQLSEQVPDDEDKGMGTD